MPKTLKLYDPKRLGKRKCGSCTGCCLTPSLSAPPVKPLCEACPKVGSGRKAGCTIYESRPTGCADYQCHWLLNGLLETKHRPDKIGIIFDDGQIRQEGFWEKLGHDLHLSLPPMTAREIWPGAFKRQGVLLKTLASELVVILVRNPADPTSELKVLGPNADAIRRVHDAIEQLIESSTDDV